MSDGDTIFALSSGAPPAAIAVMRVSGPAAGPALEALAGHLPPPRHATLRKLRAPSGEVLDHALVLWFPGPHTATGEDLAELHLHGSRAVVAAVDRVLCAQGLRPARGGEFTRRALVNGRVDLAQVEGLAALLVAESEDERQLAMATTEGQLSRAMEGWYGRLARMSAVIEARLDHAEEDDVAAHSSSIVDELQTLLTDVRDALATPNVERLRDGPTIVLAGPPNAGKSSLFNALTERDGAIVTPVAGTTRDVLDASVMRAGRAFRVIDTAGISEADDPVERIGVERARAAAMAADLVLWLGDDRSSDAAAWWVNARCDLPGREARDGTVASVSVLQPASVQRLWHDINLYFQHGSPRRGTFLLTERQRAQIVVMAEAVEDATATVDDLEIAEDLRVAIRALDELLGRISPEAILDEIFASFCIGK